jgi:hypothetical protein
VNNRQRNQRGARIKRSSDYPPTRRRSTSKELPKALAIQPATKPDGLSPISG